MNICQFCVVLLSFSLCGAMLPRQLQAEWEVQHPEKHPKYKRMVNFALSGVSSAFFNYGVLHKLKEAYRWVDPMGSSTLYRIAFTTLPAVCPKVEEPFDISECKAIGEKENYICHTEIYENFDGTRVDYTYLTCKPPGTKIPW